MEYVTRRESGLVAPTSISLISRSLGIFDHWTAGSINQSVREIQRFHMEGRGWTDIAYSWLVDVEGTIYEGRGWGRAGAHTAGYNSVSHAVCAIAGTDSDITEAMLDGMATVMHEHDRLYGEGFHLPHRDARGAATACPGDRITAWVHGGFPGGNDVSEQRIIDAVAGFEHDTRRLILGGQVRAEEMHREAMVAEWRTRKLVKALAPKASAKALDAYLGSVEGTFHVPEDDEDRDLIVLAEDADFIATEGKRQLAELDVETFEGGKPLPWIG